MVRRKTYRMSIPVVIIGYIFLVPSVLGMLFGILMLVSSFGAGASAASEVDKSVRAELVANSIPAPVIEKIMANKPIDHAMLVQFTPQQQEAIKSSSTQQAAGKVGAGVGTAAAMGFSVILIVMFFVGGLVGWLLVMKKKILQCDHCSAVVAAS